MVWAYLLFAFAAGVVLALQAGINAELAEWLHSPVRAAFVSFLVGTLLLLPAAALVVRPLPSWGRLGAAPWWVWVGGPLGGVLRRGGCCHVPEGAGVALVRIF